MSTVKKKSTIFESEEGKLVKQALQVMVLDKAYKTESSYTANVAKYPNKLIPFIDTHMTYLNKHPEIRPEHYLSNLRISLKIRG